MYKIFSKYQDVVEKEDLHQVLLCVHSFDDFFVCDENGANLYQELEKTPLFRLIFIDGGIAYFDRCSCIDGVKTYYENWFLSPKEALQTFFTLRDKKINNLFEVLDDFNTDIFDYQKNNPSSVTKIAIIDHLIEIDEDGNEITERLYPPNVYQNSLYMDIWK